eukprot:2217939-Pleurochrysis_carterae.AAC.4
MSLARAFAHQARSHCGLARGSVRRHSVGAPRRVPVGALQLVRVRLASREWCFEMGAFKRVHTGGAPRSWR